MIDAFGESVPFISHLISHPLLEHQPFVVLDCDYVKAPENPSPAPTDDVRDVVEYVFARPEEFNLDKVTMGGFSAGANMSLGVSAVLGKEAREGKLLGKQRSTSSPEHPIKALIAFYPPTEWDSRPDIKLPPGAPGIPLPRTITNLFDGAYFYPPGPLTKEEDDQRKERQRQTALFTPRWADPRDLPRTIGLITCEYDPLCAEAENLRAELTKPEHGKEVKGWMVKGVGHAWDVLAFSGQPGFEEKTKAHDLAAEIIAKVGGRV